MAVVSVQFFAKLVRPQIAKLLVALTIFVHTTTLLDHLCF